MMRSIVHPGTPDSRRIYAVPSRAHSVDAKLAVGQTLLDAVAAVIDQVGGQVSDQAGAQTLNQQADQKSFQGGAFSLNGGALSSFNYVMPALSRSSEHAVYFSDTFQVEGVIKLETARVTYGQRQGRPWLHCHAVWVEPNGRRHCGHLLPDQVRVAEPIHIQGVALEGAAFAVCPDTETNFSLFLPVSTNAAPPVTESSSLKLKSSHSSVPQTSMAFALRIAPNEDLCEAIELFCQTQGIQQAIIVGGVGSTVGASFQDGRVVEPFVTELLIQSGKITSDENGHVHAEIDVAIIDYTGGFSEGRLARGGNPVLVTAELVLCPQ